jgi:hypothetical protein
MIQINNYKSLNNLPEKIKLCNTELVPASLVGRHFSQSVILRVVHRNVMHKQGASCCPASPAEGNNFTIFCNQIIFTSTEVHASEV